MRVARVLLPLLVLLFVSLTPMNLSGSTTYFGEGYPWIIVIEADGSYDVIDDGCYDTLDVHWDSNSTTYGYESHVVFSPCGRCNC